jgi:DNA-binding response OmpR family regulator
MDLINNKLPLNGKDKQSVLVVEDSDEVREFLVTFLSMQYFVYSADNGQSGIELAIDKQPDMIISDIMMPVSDGFELVAQLSQNEQTCHIPIILITAKTDDESQLRGLSLGAVDYITKPFDIKNISFKLNNILLRQKKIIIVTFNKRKTKH